MHRLYSFLVASILGATLAALLPLPARAQDPYQYETDLVAKRRVFRDVGAGFRAIRRGPHGNYYILTAPSPAVQIYSATGTRVGQIPSESAVTAKGAALIYGESFDVDADGRVVVSDRGANAVKVYSPNGELAATIPVSSPESVAFLPGGEFAVASPRGDHLVTGYDLRGKVVRDYGDREEIADRAEINDQVNFGHLEADETGNSYFAFDYLPEPTVRKFDRVGYLQMDLSLNTLEFQPAAQAARKAIARSDNGIPSLHRIISAIGIDPKTQDIWLALGTLLIHFDKDGQRLASFRTYSPGDARIEPSAILVEPEPPADRRRSAGRSTSFLKPARLPQ